jgi:gamma-glutamylcyclotransferase
LTDEWGEEHEYFSYGSNMALERITERCPGATARRRGILREWRLLFDKATNDWDGSAAANIEPAPGEVVEGVLYTLTAADLMRLDRYEGHPRHYSRRILAVEEKDGERVAAWVYIATPDYRRNGLRPRRDYVAWLLAGADLLSPEYRARLAAVETFEDATAPT